MALISVELCLGGAALVSVVLDGIEDVELTRARPGGQRIRRLDAYLPVARVEDLGEPLADALHEHLDILLQTAGWTDASPSFDGATWVGYQDNRNYPD